MTRWQRAALIAAAPDFVLSAYFAYVLLKPMAGSNMAWVINAPVLFWLELLAVQASVIISIATGGDSRRSRWTGALVVLAFYGVMLGYLWISGHHRGLIASVAILIAVRAYAATYSGDIGRRFGFSILVLFTYGGLLWLVFHPALPRGGIDAQALAAYHASGGDSGIFREPHRAVVFCTLYFLFLGVLELARVPGGWLPLRDPPDLNLVKEGMQLRFAPEEVELREVRNFSDLLAWAGLPLMFLLFALKGDVVAAVFAVLALLVLFNAWTRVLVVRARKGRLDWCKESALGGRQVWFVEAAGAAKLATGPLSGGVPAPVKTEEKDKGALILFGKPDPFVIGSRMTDQAKGSAIARILRAYVKHGSGKLLWSEISADAEVRALLGSDGEQIICRPTHARLPPLSTGRQLPKRFEAY
jgi:hypothetical protein